MTDQTPQATVAMLDILDNAQAMAGIAKGYREALAQAGFSEGWVDIISVNYLLWLQAQMLGRR